jgi:integrase
VAKTARQRIPKLRFTAIRGIGWHVAFRDKGTGHSRRYRFGVIDRQREPDARALYHKWLAEYLGGPSPLAPAAITAKPPTKHGPKDKILSGSILAVSTSFIEAERTRMRGANEPRRRGTIAAPVFRDLSKQVRDFLEFLNGRHGNGAVARMRLADISMEDIEYYNRYVAAKGFSASQVAKRMQLVKAIIDRAGRPEHGRQVLRWNWDSRDVAHGAPPRERLLPTAEQLRTLLRSTDLRGKTIIWLGLGLGLGAKDLAVIRVGQIAKDAYDLRRAKTGVERYGETPPLVWMYVNLYQTRERRQPGELLFVTRNGVPLVQSSSNAVTQWWAKLRTKVGYTTKTLSGFYTLRHLGATEFGSRPGTSIGEVKRWLGHTASSDMADLYMRPVRPEYRKVIQFVRRRLFRPSLSAQKK